MAIIFRCYVFLFKLNANLFGFVRDLYVCFIYIAPVNSSYVKSTGLDKQVFARLEEDIVRYNLKGDIMLMSDLNVHINSDDCDFIYKDDDRILESFFYQIFIFLIIISYSEILKLYKKLTLMVKTF